MTLSKDSKHLPSIKECETCPFVNKCDSGEKCVVKPKHRDRTAYYKQNRERILARAKGVKP